MTWLSWLMRNKV